VFLGELEIGGNKRIPGFADAFECHEEFDGKPL